jgi:amino acid adenylation domain-containing protein
VTGQFSNLRENYSTLVELLHRHAIQRPEQVAFSFWAEDTTAEVCRTYRELDERARVIGAQLQAFNAAGERVLLLYPPCLDYVAAFFGCLYAGAVAVPAYPPRLNRPMPRLQAIVADAQVTMALTTDQILTSLESRFDHLPDLRGLHWRATDRTTASVVADWQPPAISADSLAFLQYTSGSTATPKGVMLTHGNLLHNLTAIQRCFETDTASRGVFWLPLYHDMGLIGGMLETLYCGGTSVLMSPVDFLQRPLRWLQTISRTHATISGGPNFAYDLCVDKITPQERARLDLSSWRLAFSGAEPIRAETLDRFAEAFAPCGFQPEAFYPCYGLAEGTLIVSGGAKAERPIIKHFNTSALQQRRVIEEPIGSGTARSMVSCGRTVLNQEIVIAHPEQLTSCAPDEIGEIWVAGPSIAQGYWNNPTATAQTFQARLADSGHGPFLRTGDLGFLHDGELFVTSRLKDLIIIRGRNHYPQDIELTVEQSHAVLRMAGGAAFSVELAGEERLVVVQELERHYRNVDLNEVMQTIREAVASEHELQVYAVVLIKTGSILKTSSGKIQRRACRAAFLDNTLEVIAQHRLDYAPTETPTVQAEPSFIHKALSAVQDRAARQMLLTLYLQEQVARVLHVASAQISLQQPLTAFGLDSLMAIELKHEIETSLGVALPLAEVLQGPSIAELADLILGQFDTNDKTSAVTPATAAALPIEDKPTGPLSQGQHSLWFMYQLAPESAAYNVPCAVRIRSPLDIPALQRSLQTIVKRHPSLRTTFTATATGPVQQLHDNISVNLDVVDAAAWSEVELKQRLAAEAHRPFDLEQAPLLRAQLFRRSETDSILLLVMHHIATDFWSLAILAEELSVLYPAECNNQPVTLPAPRAPYGHFAHRQIEMLSGARGEQLRAYWQQQLSGELPVLHLPTDRPRPAVQTYRGNVHVLPLTAALTEQLKALSKQAGVTLNTLLLAAFQTLLNRYTGQDDFCVGSLAAGRTQAEWAGTVGYFVNPIVLRARLNSQQTFRQVLEQTRQTLLGAFDHQDYPFNMLVDQIQPVRDFSRAPLFQVMFVFQRSYKLNEQGLTPFGLDISGAQMELAGLQLESLALEHRFAQFDLTLTMGEADRELIASFEYNTDLFDAATIARLAKHLDVLLHGIVADPASPVARLPLLTEAELQQQLATWQGMSHPRGGQPSIQDWFEAQAALMPQATAVMCGTAQLSYAELNQRADQLAAHLQQCSVQPEIVVGLYVERSVEMIVGVLGVLKAGGAYLPLDPTYPAERLAWMLADTQAPLLLTQQHLRDRVPHSAAQVIVIDRAEIADRVGEIPHRYRTADHRAACLIYTSGSTGQPKGVVLEQYGLVNLVRSFIHSYQPTPDDRLLPLTSIASASFVGEILPLLCTGGTLVLPSEEELLDFEKQFKLIEQQGVSIISTVPAMIAALNAQHDRVPRVRLILSGGEALGSSDIDRLMAHIKIVNGYGLTETTVCSTFHDLDSTDFQAGGWLPIGRPIINTQVYVLDADLNCVPIGCRGELYVAGYGLARGYWNRPDLTAERFIPNPYRPGERMYRTGDMARWLPGGVLEYLHRTDHQVKIRGYRVELGEVQAAIKQHPAVKEAFVMVREDTPGHKRLVAYVVSSNGTINTSDLQHWLIERLPLPLVPNAFVPLDGLPVLPNGKVDANALPSLDESRPALTTVYAAPHSETEQAIAAIWQSVLKVERVGLHDNFFELGGNSLLIAQAHQQLRAKFTTELSLVDMFKYPTINALARHLSQNDQSTPPQYQAVQEQAQKRREALRQREHAARQRLRG